MMQVYKEKKIKRKRTFSNNFVIDVTLHDKMRIFSLYPPYSL